ncbi:adenosylcobinamide-GDP ribazoletransferase [Halococcus saccharolyticus]|uniref:Adenosylcobinamide-GDP ribazoletransferase n=1 Tax=Halococcus saccharolyticus DSM 5350 TaxID=1227455 RepID=M0MHP0_9EURY|nr:adenosylcobinamide-GDP ribazoletransferase [Halococcus saccharolyticus]EMA44858.1 cobalamin 5'-phosphate synthase [Halococcus saccharolyticus DSM 5350]
MVLTALRGALGFLSRFPVGRDGDAWAAFAERPIAFPLVGYLLGALVGLSLLIPGPPATVGIAFAVGVYAVTGINHVDGVADLGDALAVHGDATAQREVMKDTTLGVGGALAVALVVAGLVTAGSAIAALPAQAAFFAVAAEVGAKAGMASLVCVGSSPHDGLGAGFTANASPRALGPVWLLALPATLLAWPAIVPAAVALLAAGVVALAVLRWARSNLGGVTGDVLGAANEIARVAALHAGVIAWTHW